MFYIYIILLSFAMTFFFCFLQLNELFQKSDINKDFKSVRVQNLAPSNSLLAFVEVHLDAGEITLPFVSLFFLKVYISRLWTQIKYIGFRSL